jgi:catechol 2,3-dioxygenase-like lactoylglutathione lyase family enzyme
VTAPDPGRKSTPGIGIIGMDHVQTGMPVGGEAEARAFYAGLLGLVEVQKPAALSGRGGCWFSGRELSLHIGVETPFVPAGRAHVAFVVHDLDVAREVLSAAGVRQVEDDSGVGYRRSYAFDPFGNRIELVDSRDAGFTEPGRRRVATGS